MNIRSLLLFVSNSFPPNFSVIASISLNSICREISSELVWVSLGSRHVFHIFFILFGAIILSRGIFRFAAALQTGGRELPDGGFRIIAHYEIIVSKLEAQKT